MTIAYVEHPCSKQEKNEYRKKFDKVIDAQFAPKKLGKDDRLFLKSEAPKAPSKPKA